MSTINITVHDNFHNNADIVIRVHSSHVNMASHTFNLTEYQRKRIEKEMCGIKCCSCDPCRRSTYTDKDGFIWGAY